MMCAKPLKHSKIRSGMVLDNVSLTHHDLHDLCKPVDGFACDIIDIAVDFAVDFFWMNEEEGYIRHMEMLDWLRSKSSWFVYNVSHNEKKWS